MSGRAGILFAVPGTTCPEARGAFECIGRTAATRFPGVIVRWTYTSPVIRRKLAAQGVEVKDPGQALLALQADGVTQAAVVSLHMTDGMEYGELADAVAVFGRQPGTRMSVALGAALMVSEPDWTRVLKAVWAELPGTPAKQDRVILVAHGSTDPQAGKTFKNAVSVCCRVDPRLTLGMILGSPDRDAVVRDCLAANVKKVWLVPCFVAAGYSARDEIAGPGEASWATALSQAGIEVVPVVKGLGEMPGVVDVWLDQAERLLATA